jgi:hypothetical protein
MNAFLANLDVTFRRDERTGRPRINKTGSRKDREQKAAGEYYDAPTVDYDRLDGAAIDHGETESRLSDPSTYLSETSYQVQYSLWMVCWIQDANNVSQKASRRCRFGFTMS